MKVAIHGFYGAGNAGDDAILHAMIQTLKSINQSMEIVVIVRSQKIKAYYGDDRIKTVSGFDHFSIFKELQECKLLLVGGGGLFQDYNEFKPYDLFKNQKGAINYYLVPILLAKMLDVKTMLYAVGIGPLQKEESRKTMAWIANIVDEFTVRDQHSIHLLRELGVKNSKLSADPAIGLQTEKLPSHSDKQKSMHKKIGINIRNWSFDTTKSQNAIQTMLEVLNELQRKQPAEFMIFPFNSLPSEIQLATSFANKLNGRKRIIPYNMSPTKYKEICRDLDLMIGMRLHANIFAIGAEVPSIGISYDPKVKGFFQECELEDLCFNLHDVTALKLNQLIQNVLTNNTYWKEKVHIACKQLIHRETVNKVALSQMLK